MWSTNQWRPLDLRRRGQLGPREGELIVLHMIPKSGGRSERYDVGKLLTEAGKSYFEGQTGTLPVARVKKFYDIWWLRLPINENLSPRLQ